MINLNEIAALKLFSCVITEYSIKGSFVISVGFYPACQRYFATFVFFCVCTDY